MKQNKTIFFVSVAILIIIVIYWVFSFLINDMSEFRKIKQEMISAESNFKKLSNERANYSSIKEARDRQIQYFDTLKIHIPLKENDRGTNPYIETLDIIQQVAEKNNIAISVFRPILTNTFPDINVKDKQLNKTIKRYLLEMECNGDFLSIGKFFEALQNQERFVNLLKFDIETERGIDGRLLCKALLYTYVFSEYN
ncbi:type 4a pilus biogenesis protein PilO [bacterium]|nr:type 4a pilus biogenesis protein PilO [bacterium]